MSNVTDNFKQITGYDIALFLRDYATFATSHYGSIVNYYKGGNIVPESFNYLDYLKAETINIDGLFQHYQYIFNTVDFLELIDVYSDIKIKLMTVENLNRWLRSSRLDRYNADVVITYVQKQGESIEMIAKKAGSIDENNDWIALAIDNDLNEEKYTSQGGAVLNVRLKNNLNFDIQNIVDSLSQQNVYGKDIKNKLELVNGDLVSLSGENSLLQTIENIFNTQKGSIPEYPEDGVDSNLSGSNVNIFNYPAQFRNILAMIQKDDRFKTLTLLDVKRIDDYTEMTFQIKTKIGDIFQQHLMI